MGLVSTYVQAGAQRELPARASRPNQEEMEQAMNTYGKLTMLEINELAMLAGGSDLGIKLRQIITDVLPGVDELELIGADEEELEGGTYSNGHPIGCQCDYCPPDED